MYVVNNEECRVYWISNDFDDGCWKDDSKSRVVFCQHISQ